MIKIQFNIGSGERVARELSLLVAITLALGFAGAFIFVSAGELGNLRLRRTFETFGIFLMVSATSSLIYQVIFKPQMDKRFLDKMQSAFQSELARLLNVTSFGLVSIQKKIDFAAIFNSLEPGDELLWLDTYAPDEMGWIENLERAVSRGAAVKMLVLNPNSKLVQLRAEEIVSSHFSPEKFREGLTKFYQDMLHCQEEGQGRMEVRVYDDLLGCPVYLIARNGQARKAISSLYLSTATYAFPHFVWEASAERQILDALENYFRKKWSKASGADGTRVSG